MKQSRKPKKRQPLEDRLYDAYSHKNQEPDVVTAGLGDFRKPNLLREDGEDDLYDFFIPPEEGK